MTMIQFKYDMHVHTSETSHCGNVSGKDMVGMYKKAGYHGVVITDHYFEGFFGGQCIKSWDFHQLDDLARGGIILSEEINTSAGLVSAIRNGKITELILR